MAFLQILISCLVWEGVATLRRFHCIAEIERRDIDLYKKSEIIEIASVVKKLQHPKVDDISKKSRLCRIFVIYFNGFAPKTVPKHRISKKVFLKVVFQFSIFYNNI